MSSFWVVENRRAIEHVGRPKRAGNTSFAIGCSDEDYLNAGLYTHVNWEGTFDVRTQTITGPTFVVDPDKQEVRTEYVVKDKSQAEIDAYDAEQAVLIAESISAIAKEKLKEIDLLSIRSMREYIAAKEDAPQFLKNYELLATDERKKIK